MPDVPASTSNRTRILLVEDDGDLRSAIATSLGAFGSVEELGDGAAATARIADPSNAPYALIVSDLRLPGADGYAVLAAARARDSRTLVLIVSAFGTLEGAVAAMRAGASDFLSKPFALRELELRVRELVGSASSGAGPSPATLRPPIETLIAESPAMREVADLARRVAPTRSTVLITGETGTGKEVIAGLIHDLSPRAGGPFVKVNCAAVPETLLESELFGHERGAFTGADRRRSGRFEQAAGGTLFLDEIGELSLTTQTKLLRVLQEREFRRLGGVEVLRTEARIVAATNQDLGRSLADGRFRQDLFFRLNVIGIHLVPLRERPEDAVALAKHFLTELSREIGCTPRTFSVEALERIREHRWSGNVRELRNAIERALLMSDRPSIEPHQIVAAAPEGSLQRPTVPVEIPPEGISLRDVEHGLVLRALEQAEYVQKDAARLLRVSRRKLNYMIRRLGVTHPTWRRNRGPGPGVPQPPAQELSVAGLNFPRLHPRFEKGDV